MQLDSHLCLKSDGESGVKTIWLGLKDVCAAAETIRMLRGNGGDEELCIRRCSKLQVPIMHFSKAFQFAPKQDFLLLLAADKHKIAHLN